MPRVIGPHPLRQMWAYKYDQRLTGIRAHADSAAVNVDFGLLRTRPIETQNQEGWLSGAIGTFDWNFKRSIGAPMLSLKWTESAGAERVEVPYRANRAVIFNSELVHRTADLDFQSGYENRRINVTMLFGRRGDA